MKNIYLLVKSLKNLKRQGWLERGLAADSVADHAFGTMVLAWSLANTERVNADRVLQMLLIHDLVMAKMEDVTPRSGKYDQKRDLEEKVKAVVATSFPGDLPEKYLALFDEFTEGKTKESRVAKEADKLETLYQGEIFEEETGRNDILSDFLETYWKTFQTETGMRLFKEIEGRHKARRPK